MDVEAYAFKHKGQEETEGGEREKKQARGRL